MCHPDFPTEVYKSLYYSAFGCNIHISGERVGNNELHCVRVLLLTQYFPWSSILLFLFMVNIWFCPHIIVTAIQLNELDLVRLLSHPQPPHIRSTQVFCSATVTLKQ